MTDFGKFYASAQFFRDGQDIYSPVAITALGPLPPDTQLYGQFLHPNLNLPVVTALFVPLTFLDFSAAFMCWSAFSMLCGLVAIRLVASKLQVTLPRGTGTLWLAILLLSYYPTWCTIRLGQVSLVLFLLLAMGWAAAREDKYRLAGLAIGLALLLKIFVLALIPFFLAAKRWRLAIWSLGVFAAGLLFSLAACGLDAHRAYIDAISGITWYGFNWNASLLGFFSRIFGGAENTPAIDAPW
ncbi:glycosyltransferase family 87 protein, partial [uncultured Thiodictyon sp.]|uniref:glycosyltransferase family 87 protein n=1 Tax=uncultured Thiodictyon sp. TaxID=1846217 RepID=UPI0025EB070C